MDRRAARSGRGRDRPERCQAGRARRGRGAGLVAIALACLLLAGCGEDDLVQVQPAAPDDGIVLTGRLSGRNISISDGAPEVLFGDCDPRDGRDTDLCLVTRSIGGTRLAVVIENPALLVADETLLIRGDTCRHCDDVDAHLVVELRTDSRTVRATGGSVQVREAGPRYAADLVLRLPDGSRLTGTINVGPR